jgi:D-glycero-alpha-D-manno-heptose 1-phosphate guanylyltransferase
MSSEGTVAVVLAGGFGTRVRHLLGELPKPLAPAAGRPFLEWVLRYLRRQGIAEVIVSTGFGAVQVERFAEGLQIPGLRVRCASELEPLGTAGGFLRAWQEVRGARQALVLNGDSLVLAPLAPLLDLAGAAAALLAVQVEDASRFGRLEVDAQGLLRGFREKDPAAGAGRINAGVYALPQSTIDAWRDRQPPLSFEHDVFPGLLATGAPVRVVSAAAPFLDIGTEQSLPLADEFVRRHSDWFASP